MNGSIMTAARVAMTLVAAAALLAFAPAPAFACGDGYGSHNSGGGVVIGGNQGCNNDDPGDYDPGNGPYVPTGPPPPAYEHYYTPSCMVNGPPPGNSDALCTGAVTICDSRGQPSDIYMRHYRRQVAPTLGTWEFVGSECRGADDPVAEEPQVTEEMVLDQAYAAAPRPTAAVQPGARSYVNLPNNYWADAPDETTTVNVLGNPIAITFTVTDVTWDFGDGSSASGEGVEDAEVGAPGAVEHAYSRQGSYEITATSTVGVQFTLPDGQAVNLPGAFQFSSDPVTLPVGEIQTRVDSTG